MQEEAAKSKKAYNKKIKSWRRRGFHEALDQATTDAKKLWKFTKVPKNRANPKIPHIAALETRDGGKTTDSCEIANKLRTAFFPPTRQADLSDLEGFEYPEPEIMPAITRNEVISAAHNLSMRKAPGPAGVANELLKFGLFNDNHTPRDDSP